MSRFRYFCVAFIAGAAFSYLLNRLMPIVDRHSSFSYTSLGMWVNLAPVLIMVLVLLLVIRLSLPEYVRTQKARMERIEEGAPHPDRQALKRQAKIERRGYL